MEHNGSNGRKGNTESNGTIGMNGSSNGVADMGLSTASGTVKEENLSLIVLGRVDYFVKGRFLLRVEARVIVFNPVLHGFLIISQLLIQKRVRDDDIPILLRQRHFRIILKRLFRNHEETLDKMEAIVKYVLLCRVKVTLSHDEDCHRF